MKLLLENPFGALLVALAVGVVIAAIAEGVVSVRDEAARGEFMRVCVAKSDPLACSDAWNKVER